METSKLSTSYLKQEDSGEGSGLSTVSQRLEFYAKKCPEKEAIVFASTDGDRQTVTFAELYEKSLQAARAFIHLGIKPKESVAISLRTCPEWLYVAFGALVAGARPFGAHFTYSDGSDFVALTVKLQTCSCMVMDPGFENENWNIMSKLIDNISSDGKVTSERIPSMRYLFAHNQDNGMPGVKTFQELLDGECEPVQFPEMKEDDVAMLFQTSGSTGHPKVVAYSQRGMATSYDFNLDVTRVYGSEDIYFNERPFDWIGGFPFGIFTGQTRVTCSGYCTPPKERDQFLVDTILKEKCNVIAGLPSILLGIKRRKHKFGGNWQAKIISTGGQPFTAQVFSGLKSLSKYFGIAYGATVIPMVANKIVEGLNEMVDYDCGQPLPGIEIKVVDNSENIVPIGTRGEIYIRAKRMFIGYMNDEENTNAVFCADGWFKSDDIGFMVEDGSFRVEDRKSNMIISGGMNVNPVILEKVIATCPGVEGVVLVPVPDDELYQVICTCVKVASGSDVTTDVIRKFCKDAHGDKQGSFTVLPKYYMVVDSFPTTTSGKVSRKALADIAIMKFKHQQTHHRFMKSCHSTVINTY